MNTVIDTLRYSEKLQQAGFSVEQANSMARALNDELVEKLATKTDIQALKNVVKVLNMKIDFLFAAIGLLVVLELIPIVKPLF